MIQEDAKLLRVIAEAWDQENRERFRGAMYPPAFAWETAEHRLGSWQRSTRTLAISRNLAYTQPWPEVIEVIRHEMAHQYVEEILDIRDETAHGPAFRKVCAERGICAAASGTVTLDGEQARVYERIRKLFALAESSNRFEAESAMKSAHRLLLKHNLIHLELPSEMTFRVVGEVSQRVSLAEKTLAGLISRHFFVRAIWVPAYLPHRGAWGRILELSGTTSNLEFAAYVHGFLLETAERLWRQHRKDKGLLRNAGRRQFIAGVMTGFHEKLVEGNIEAKQQGLIWIGDPRLESFVNARYPRLRGFGARVNIDTSWQEGRSAGQQIVLHKPLAEQGSGIRGRIGTAQ